MWKYGTQNIREHRSWTDDDGIQHPPNWHIWSAEEKAAAGLTEVTPETPPDSRLYTWGYEADGVTIVKTPKSLDDVEENWEPHKWMVIMWRCPKTKSQRMTGLISDGHCYMYSVRII